MDYSPRGSSVCELFLARILEWFAISSSRGSSQPRDRTWVLRRSFYCWATGGMHACVYVCRKSLKGYKTKCCQLLPLNDRIKGFFFLMIFSKLWPFVQKKYVTFVSQKHLWSWLLKYQSREIPRPTHKKKKNHGVNLFNNREVFRNMVLYVCQLFYFPSQMVFSVGKNNW